jgi:spore coat polysaccharide biosynthesis predicted glycosyltransferase SpsG
MGGSDPQNMTGRAMQAIQQVQCPGLEVRVITGGVNPRRDALIQLARGLHARIEVLSDVDDMPAQLRWADVALTAAGVTLWELLYMGTPVVAWPRYAEDIQFLAGWEKNGAIQALPLDAAPDAIAAAMARLLADRELRQSMQSAGRNLVDGRGAQRAVNLFSTFPAVVAETH